MAEREEEEEEEEEDEEEGEEEEEEDGVNVKMQTPHLLPRPPSPTSRQGTSQQSRGRWEWTGNGTFLVTVDWVVIFPLDGRVQVKRQENQKAALQQKSRPTPHMQFIDADTCSSKEMCMHKPRAGPCIWSRFTESIPNHWRPCLVPWSKTCSCCQERGEQHLTQRLWSWNCEPENLLLVLPSSMQTLILYFCLVLKCIWSDAPMI